MRPYLSSRRTTSVSSGGARLEHDRVLSSGHPVDHAGHQMHSFTWKQFELVEVIDVLADTKAQPAGLDEHGLRFDLVVLKRHCLTSVDVQLLAAALAVDECELHTDPGDHIGAAPSNRHDVVSRLPRSVQSAALPTVLAG